MTSKEGLMQMKDFLGIAIAGRESTVEKFREKEKQYLSNGENIPYDVSYNLYKDLHEMNILKIAYYRIEEIIDEVTD